MSLNPRVTNTTCHLQLVKQKPHLPRIYTPETHAEGHTCAGKQTTTCTRVLCTAGPAASSSPLQALFPIGLAGWLHPTASTGLRCRALPCPASEYGELQVSLTLLVKNTIKLQSWIVNYFHNRIVGNYCSPPHLWCSTHCSENIVTHQLQFSFVNYFHNILDTMVQHYFYSVNMPSHSTRPCLG